MQFINTLLSGISTGLVYALIALAIVLVWRSSRAINFAQAGQATLTTYIALSVQEASGNWLVALVVAIVAGFGLGALIFLLVARTLRTQGTSGALIATLGILVMLESATGLIWGEEFRAFTAPVSTTGLTMGSTTFTVGVENLLQAVVTLGGATVFFSRYDLLVVITTAILVVLLALLFNRTRIGLSMRAAALNPEVASLSGVHVRRMLLLGWAMAGAIGAVAGVLIAPLTFLAPTSFAIILIFAFTAAVVGGLDSPAGAIFGGLSTGVILAVVNSYTDTSNGPLAALFVLILTLVLHPSGLLGGKAGRSV